MTWPACATLGALFGLTAAAIAANLEAPPAPFQTFPRPAEGETVTANPPCFVYPATETAPTPGPSPNPGGGVHDAYMVEVSPDPSFPAAATQRMESPYMLAVSPQPLPPGRYCWRWRPGQPDDGATEWSPVRAFHVPADVPVVPFPDMEELVQRLGVSHPRVGVTAAELADVRERARQQFGDGWLAGVKRYAEQMRDRPLLPEPDFLPDASDPRRIEVYQKTFQTTRPFMRELVTLAENYLLTGDELSGQEGKRRLLHIIGWDPRGSTSLGHNDEPATEIVRYCPTAFDRLYPLLTAEEKQKCLACLTVRMQEIRDLWQRRPFEKNPYESHNMGYYLPDMVEAGLALVGEAPVEEMLRYTLLQLWSPFYPPYGGADGGWCEGPSYWGWSTAVFARTYRLVERATGVPVHLRSHVRRMSLYKIYGNPPYFKMSPFGDGQESPAGGGVTMAMLAALYNDPYAKWHADWQNVTLGGLDRLLFDTRRVKSEPPYNRPQGQAFYDIGLAAMHSALPDPTSNVALLLRSCPFGSISHAYADQNSFVLDAYGEPLIIASGYYQLYGHPHHAEWTRQTQASNSVLVNGEGQLARDWNAKGRLATFQTTAAGDYAVGDAKQAYAGKLDRFDRRVVFLRPIHTGGAPIIVIRDELAAPQPATYQFLLHALNRMEVDPAQQRVTIAQGASRCRVDYLAPQGLRFDQHDQFTHPPFQPSPNQWHLTASTVDPAPTAGSLIVLQPFREGEADQLLAAQMETPAGYAGVRLTGADRMILVMFLIDADAPPPAPPYEGGEQGGVVTDAQAFSLRFINPPQWKVRSAVLFEGTRLQLGAALLQSDVPAALSGSLYGASWRLVSSDAPHGAHLAADFGQRDTWTHGDGPAVAVFEEVAEGVAANPGGLPAPTVQVPGSEPVPFEVTHHEWVQRLVARASVPGPRGHYEAALTLGNAGTGSLPVVVAAGSASLRQTLAPGQKETKVVLPAANLGGGQELTVTADEAIGGQLLLSQAAVQRAYGVNLLPNGSFEEVADGVPVGWRATTITQNAQAALASAEGGRNGGKCLKITCTEATGGDFGAILNWPGITLSEEDRRFRMACWVKTDATSVAGLQVTSADWTWWKNTERLKDRPDWAEAALEFILPAGQNLTHVRLHANAAKSGAELFVDDVSLVEVPRP